MRSMWTGHIGFGLVQVPVKLYKATESHDQEFHQHHGPTCLGRIGYAKLCKDCGAVVDYDDIVKGTEVEPGRVVIINEDDLASLETEQGKQIEILSFVEAAEIDPVMYEGTYYLGGGEVGRNKMPLPSKPYALLANAMQEAGLVAMARFTMRTKTRLAAIRAVPGPESIVLVLHTLVWPDELRQPEVPGLGAKYTKAEMKAASMVVESMVDKFDPTRFVDTYQMRLVELIEARTEDAEFVIERPADLDGDAAGDLLAQLNASIARHPASVGRKRAPARKAVPAKKPVARKAPVKKVAAAPVKRTRRSVA